MIPITSYNVLHRNSWESHLLGKLDRINWQNLYSAQNYGKVLRILSGVKSFFLFYYTRKTNQFIYHCHHDDVKCVNFSAYLSWQMTHELILLNIPSHCTFVTLDFHMLIAFYSVTLYIRYFGFSYAKSILRTAGMCVCLQLVATNRSSWRWRFHRQLSSSLVPWQVSLTRCQWCDIL